jgi:AcrR family transcriptional regulator
MTKWDKHDRAVNAAAEQFLRYGFHRTTMADIARASGFSRPALYLLLPGKEQAFEAAVLHLNHILMAQIESALENCMTLSDRLFAVCELWLVQVYGLQLGNPDAKDMDDLAFPVVRSVYARLQDKVAEILLREGAKLDASAASLARLLVFAVRGLGATAADLSDMRELTRLQVDLFCRALASRASRSDA